MADVTARAADLTAALEVGAPWLDPIVVDQTIVTVERSMQRLELGADHTVVALVGATGSGKSSLFNALAKMEIAEVGARRPLTSQPMACVWGESGSQQLLDWLEVPSSRRITRESILDADGQAALHGLVLLDLPDHDSTEVIHRVEVDRLVNMVDLLVWVVDPQKYADDALHSGYLQRLVEHDDVMVVVLNQIDRLRPDEAITCERDLRRLLDSDGLGAVAMLPVSARRGDGVDQLRSVLADVVQHRSAVTERIDADLRVVTEAVLMGLAPAEPGNGEPPGADRLIQELAAAAGVPFVIDAVASQYHRRGWRIAGWPLLRWLGRVSAPLTRDRPARSGARTEQDLKLIMAALPPVSAPAQRARVELAVEATVAASADLLPQRWADAVREGVYESGGDLAATLDQQIAGVDLTLRPPLWWRVVAAVQHALAVVTVLSLIWIAVIAAGRLVGRQGLDPNRPGGLPMPLLLLVVGLFGAALLAGLTAWALTVGSRRRQLSVQQQLRGAVELAAYQRVIVPVRVVLGQHRATRLALTRHLSGAVAGPERSADGAEATGAVSATGGTAPGESGSDSAGSAAADGTVAAGGGRSGGTVSPAAGIVVADGGAASDARSLTV